MWNWPHGPARCCVCVLSICCGDSYGDITVNHWYSIIPITFISCSTREQLWIESLAVASVVMQLKSKFIIDIATLKHLLSEAQNLSCVLVWAIKWSSSPVTLTLRRVQIYREILLWFAVINIQLKLVCWLLILSPIAPFSFSHFFLLCALATLFKSYDIYNRMSSDAYGERCARERCSWCSKENAKRPQPSPWGSDFTIFSSNS